VRFAGVSILFIFFAAILSSVFRLAGRDLTPGPPGTIRLAQIAVGALMSGCIGFVIARDFSIIATSFGFGSLLSHNAVAGNDDGDITTDFVDEPTATRNVGNHPLGLTIETNRLFDYTHAIHGGFIDVYSGRYIAPTDAGD